MKTKNIIECLNQTVLVTDGSAARALCRCCGPGLWAGAGGASRCSRRPSSNACMSSARKPKLKLRFYIRKTHNLGFLGEWGGGRGAGMGVLTATNFTRVDLKTNQTCELAHQTVKFLLRKASVFTARGQVVREVHEPANLSPEHPRVPWRTLQLRKHVTQL